MSKRTFALISAASLAFLSACSSTKLSETGPATTDAAPKAVSSVAPVVADHLNPNSLISTQRSVYFDFDKFDIKSEYSALIERQGKYLAAKPALAIRVEGNADERGGREYNLALGQKRAEAVLNQLGVDDQQIEAISYGKEKPAAEGSDESAWAKNRRVELRY